MYPSPSDLNYFIEVARCLNLSRAAERLGISQPSLTLAVRRLEHALGVELINRHKQGVTLTSAGKQFLQHVKRLLQEWEGIKTATLASLHEVQGQITLGCHEAVALFYLPQFMPDLLLNYPKLEIILKHDISRKIAEQIINFHIDIGIVVNPIEHPDLVIKKLATDKVCLWHSKNPTPLQDLKAGTAVLICHTELVQAQFIIKKMKHTNLNYKRILNTANLDLIAKLVQAGAGVGIIPASVAKSFDLVELEKAPFYADDICLLYRGENRSIKALQVIAQAIQQCFKLAA